MSDRRIRLCFVALLTLPLWLGVTAPAHANAVTQWNEITLAAVTVGRPGPSGLLDIAITQAAVHDAVQAIEGRYEPYFASVPGASGSPQAAVAGAAYGVLVNLYPAQAIALTAQYDAFVAANGLAGDPGLAVGAQAAAQLLTQYRPASAVPGPAPSTVPGDWRPTPSFLTPEVPLSFSPMAVPYLATTTPFTLESPSQFRPEGPPAVTSGRYAREYAEVKAMGALTGSARTPEQTDLAYFWSENFIAQWNRALRGIALAHVPGEGDAARLFALAALSAGDAAITAWDSKLHFHFWRPVTAIREGDADGNKKTEGDVQWQPLINTPNYPDFTSGANNLTGSFTTILRKFFRTDRFEFTVTSNAPAAIVKSRTYQYFSDAADEVVEARILLGIHFRSADEVARKQGTRVARWTFKHVLQPVRECDRDDDDEGESED